MPNSQVHASVIFEPEDLLLAGPLMTYVKTPLSSCDLRGLVPVKTYSSHEGTAFIEVRESRKVEQINDCLPLLYCLHHCTTLDQALNSGKPCFSLKWLVLPQCYYIVFSRPSASINSSSLSSLLQAQTLLIARSNGPGTRSVRLMPKVRTFCLNISVCGSTTSP